MLSASTQVTGEDEWPSGGSCWFKKKKKEKKVPGSHVVASERKKTVKTVNFACSIAAEHGVVISSHTSPGNLWLPSAEERPLAMGRVLRCHGGAG